jgi:hypothetical protein
MNRALLFYITLSLFLLPGLAHGKPKKPRLEYPLERGIVRQLDAITVFKQMPEGRIEPYMTGTMIESLHAQMQGNLSEAGGAAALRKRPGESVEDYKKRRDEIFADIDDFSPNDPFFFVPGPGSEVPGNGVTFDGDKNTYSLVLPASTGLIMNKIVLFDEKKKIWNNATGPSTVNHSELLIHYLVFDQPGPMAPLTLAVTPEKARELRDGVKAGYIVSLVPPYMGRGVVKVKPTAKDPSERKIMRYVVFAKLRRGILFRGDTGEILAQRDY